LWTIAVAPGGVALNNAGGFQNCFESYGVPVTLAMNLPRHASARSDWVLTPESGTPLEVADRVQMSIDLFAARKLLIP
jgi:hypothetical protein